MHTPITALAAPQHGVDELVRRELGLRVRAEDCDVLMQAAWRHADRGMPEEAEQDCRKAIAIAAFDPRPYYLLAQLAQECGDATQAKTLLTKAIYLDTSFMAACLELCALHAQAGENEIVRLVVSILPGRAGFLRTGHGPGATSARRLNQAGSPSHHPRAESKVSILVFLFPPEAKDHAS